MRYALKLVLWTWAALLCIIGVAAVCGFYVYGVLQLGQWIGLGPLGCLAVLIVGTLSLGVFGIGLAISHMRRKIEGE